MKHAPWFHCKFTFVYAQNRHSGTYSSCTREQKLQEAQARVATQDGADGGGGSSSERGAEAKRRAEEPHLLNIHEDPVRDLTCAYVVRSRAPACHLISKRRILNRIGCD